MTRLEILARARAAARDDAPDSVQRIEPDALEVEVSVEVEESFAATFDREPLPHVSQELCDALVGALWAPREPPLEPSDVALPTMRSAGCDPCGEPEPHAPFPLVRVRGQSAPPTHAPPSPIDSVLLPPTVRRPRPPVPRAPTPRERLGARLRWLAGALGWGAASR